MEETIESDLGEFKSYLYTGNYPVRMKGKPGLKSNLRRKAARFIVKEGILHYKHKPKRNGKSCKYFCFSH